MLSEHGRRIAAPAGLVRLDDPPAVVEQASIDVAVIRGRIPDGSPVRRTIYPAERFIPLVNAAPGSGRG